MIDLLLSVVFATSLFLIFKWFEKYGVDNSQGIIFNYLTAFTLGVLFNTDYNYTGIHEESWFWNTIILGVTFVTIFNVMAVTSQKIGVSVTSVANKMSLIVPVVVAYLIFQDQMTWLKIAGVALAIPGVILVSKPRRGSKRDMRYFYLPIIVFLGSGFIDTFLNYSREIHQISDQELFSFIPPVFLTAAITGTILLLIRKKKPFQWKNVFWGIVLGIPNYGSIYFIMRALKTTGWESSVVFPVNNMAVVALSAVSSLLLFQERLTQTNWIGIILSLAAIGLIILA